MPDQKGVALVLTLAVIALLSALTVRMGESVDVQLQDSDGLMQGQRLDFVVLSGLNLVRAALRADQERDQTDTLTDGWNQWDRDRLTALFPGDGMDIEVTDLSGLIQINALVPARRDRESKSERQRHDRQAQRQRTLWMRFLLSGRFAVEDETRARELVDALIDWLDPDDQEREFGAESGSYQDRDRPYPCRNGPMLYPEELALVRGFSPLLLHGDGEHEGILPYLTIHGRDGAININTAPVAVLEALMPALDRDLVQALDEFRRDPDNRDLLARPDWYRKVAGVPGDLVIDSLLLTTRSRYFLIRVRAGYGMVNREGWGVVQRDTGKQSQTLLRFRTGPAAAAGRGYGQES